MTLGNGARALYARLIATKSYVIYLPVFDRKLTDELILAGFLRERGNDEAEIPDAKLGLYCPCGECGIDPRTWECTKQGEYVPADGVSHDD